MPTFVPHVLVSNIGCSKLVKLSALPIILQPLPTSSNMDEEELDSVRNSCLVHTVAHRARAIPQVSKSTLVSQRTSCQCLGGFQGFDVVKTALFISSMTGINVVPHRKPIIPAYGYQHTRDINFFIHQEGRKL